MTVTQPQGFLASGVASGLKSTGATDLALLVNQGPSQVAAARFTKNRIQAAPVQWTRQVMTTGSLHAVVLNSGGANACTGPDGFADTHKTAEKVADKLHCGAIDVAVCSTGLIGERLNMDQLLPGVDQAAKELTAEGGSAAANAILTTDTSAKEAVYRSSEDWTMGAMAKGAGMLAPSLATMLAVITTDAKIDALAADSALATACEYSFDRLDSDGSTSTNDTVLLLSSGAVDVTPDVDEFNTALQQVCHTLAQSMLTDAEGATKDIAITVTGADSEADAVETARAIARDNLVKCAFFGQDPNWGRILAAVGCTDAIFEPDQVDVAINDVWICRNGYAAADRNLVDLSSRDVAVTVNLNAGEATATVWTNDLSHDYVHENSAYSS
ncbi:bifunctional glutamate N-acetyltransferase/amino-acid acetyltransferase ArgJ [Haloglycomyces albus]|uniref:bifunctional glutamate N-acetyltransferase/amino-acid acetyltransferase ArgJ n=1 Tax=Haloglycomyces albus TaxID=526067 RepID=UPI00046D58B7|nr:bifunctional glutamate N-acetyltransferase/amino-acid acetyltransferase ArgJ [Haloglycomyces albus]